MHEHTRIDDWRYWRDGLDIRAEDRDDDGDDLPPTPETGDPALDAIFREREAIRKEAVVRYHADLKATAETLGDRLIALIEGKAGSKEADRVRAAVYRTELTELIQIVREAGYDAATEEWFRRYSEIAGLAEEQLGAVGVADAERLLDGATAKAALAAQRDGDADALFDAVVRPSADRIMRGLRTSIELQPLSEVARIVARDEGVSLPQGDTLAKTRIAEFDRWSTAEAARQADPDGDVLFWAYYGPDDGIERPFCDALNGLYFTREQIGRLDNNQPGTGHPAISGGGYNCRHGWIQGSAEYLEALGYKRGTDADIEEANAAAQEKRRAA